MSYASRKMYQDILDKQSIKYGGFDITRDWKEAKQGSNYVYYNPNDKSQSILVNPNAGEKSVYDELNSFLAIQNKSGRSLLEGGDFTYRDPTEYAGDLARDYANGGYATTPLSQMSGGQPIISRSQKIYEANQGVANPNQSSSTPASGLTSAMKANMTPQEIQDYYAKIEGNNGAKPITSSKEPSGATSSYSQSNPQQALLDFQSGKITADQYNQWAKSYASGGQAQGGTQGIPSQPTEKPTTGFDWDGVNLKYGMRSDDVKELQTYLKGIGVTDSEGNPLKPDGIFGPKTLSAVKKWQSEHGLLADGVVGQKTVAALNSFQKDGTISETAKAGNTDQRDSSGLLINPPDAKFDRNTGQPIEQKDPETQNLENALSQNPVLKALYDQYSAILDEMKKQGQVVNPDLTISPALLKQFQSEVENKLDPYYQELLRQEKENLGITFDQLQQDYEKTIQREQPQFQQNLENLDQSEAESGTAFSSGRVKREGELITGQNQRLSDLATNAQRSLQGTAIEAERKLGSRDFSSLGIPSLQSYATQSRTIAPSGSIAPTGSRQLFNPIGNLEGSLPIEKRTTYGVETQNLIEQERKRRILDAGGSLGNTVYG